MGAINDVNYKGMGNLSKEEIIKSEKTAKELLNGKESITKEELLQKDVFSIYRNNANFNTMVDRFGPTIELRELSFLVTALDASNYYHYNDTDGAKKEEDDECNGTQSFNLDGFYGDADEILAFSQKDYNDFQKKREYVMKLNNTTEQIDENGKVDGKTYCILATENVEQEYHDNGKIKYSYRIILGDMTGLVDIKCLDKEYDSNGRIKSELKAIMPHTLLSSEEDDSIKKEVYGLQLVYNEYEYNETGEPVCIGEKTITICETEEKTTQKTPPQMGL